MTFSNSVKKFLLAVAYAWCGIISVPVSAQKAPVTVIQNDSLISALLETVSYDNLLALHYTSTKRILKPGVQVVTFMHSGNSFTFYKSKYNVFVKGFEVNNPDKALGNLVVIGSSKANVLAKFQISKSADILKVSDLEGGANMSLYFNGNKLQKVTFYAIVD